MVFSIRLLCAFLISTEIFASQFSTQCGVGKECLLELPGATCGDGTPTYFTLTQRKHAKKLLIYLDGGGGCWNKDTCTAGYARNLTRVETATDWEGGTGAWDASDRENPFAEDFDVVTVPYCTGDAYTGSRVADYGSPKEPYEVRHMGYANTQRLFGAVKSLYPDPDQVVLMGCSAGGIGVNFNLRGPAATYPETDKVVISDAGTPFRPPFVDGNNYYKVMRNWGADKNLPDDVKDFGQLLRYNSQNFPSIRYSFISAYGDQVMTFFAWSVGALAPLTAVRRNIIDVAENFIGRNNPTSKVFYIDAVSHCHTPKKLSSVVSEGQTLGKWLTAQVNNESEWGNVRPDLRPGFKQKARPNLMNVDQWKRFKEMP